MYKESLTVVPETDPSRRSHHPSKKLLSCTKVLMLVRESSESL